MVPDAAITNPTYQDALRWLYQLSPNIRSAAQIVADHPRKLGRMRAFLAELGNPHTAYRAVLVAGTKGKGSIAAYTEAILRAAGLQTGLVTSPHLMSWCERTRIDGTDVTPATVARLLPTVRAAMDRLASAQPGLGQPTTFEAGLAFSFLAFAEAGVQLAVVEAGVGALHDATNVLDPLAVALGPISYDHTATLGPTLASITHEKSGAFRAGRLAVVAAQPAEARAVVAEEADRIGARLEWVGTDWHWDADDGDACRCPFTVEGPRGRFEHLASPLLGRHQRENATAAIALATGVLACRNSARPAFAGRRATERPGYPRAALSRAGALSTATTEQPVGAAPFAAAVRDGLATVRWPGRLQALREYPWLVVDGAHNGDSAGRLAEAVRACFPATRRHLVFGTSVGKDVPRMLDALLPLTAEVTLTRSHHERSVPLDELAAAVRERGVVPRAAPEVGEAIEAALDASSPDDLIVVTGSLFVVGEALELYGPDARARKGQHTL